MTLRRKLASWLCPDLVLESDRLFRIRAEISDKRRWLGYEYPALSVTLERILADDENYARREGDQLLLVITGDGTTWPADISAFRDKLRQHFAPAPRYGVPHKIPH
jgi:hypothetical protein